MIHVPLLVWGPGILPRRLPHRASLIDVGPTVLQLFGQPRPESMMGRSLLPLMRGASDTLPRPTFAEGRLRRAYLTEDGLKVIEDSVRKVVEVYDLNRDPDELTNLFDVEPERAGPAVAAMRAFFAEHGLVRDGYEPPYKP
jgi:arylsulfatase A-like enzyme